MKEAKSKSEPKTTVKKSKVNTICGKVEKMSKASKKAAKDPNKPKRAPSAFFVFMDDFRKQYKAEHPSNKSVAVVCKAGGEKWRSMSDSEKAPFVEIAEKKKLAYCKNMAAYNNDLCKEAEGVTAAKEVGSDKSKSEVHDENDDDEESCQEEDDSE